MHHRHSRHAACFFSWVSRGHKGVMIGLNIQRIQERHALVFGRHVRSSCYVVGDFVLLALVNVDLERSHANQHAS